MRNKTPKRRVKAKLREDRRNAARRTRPGRWTLFMINWRPAGSSACSRSLTRSRASRRRWSRASPSAVPMSSRCWKESGEKWGYLQRSGSTRAPSVSRDLDLWAYQRGVTLDFSRPGKPTDNAFIEAFNGRFRAECLNAQWFLSLADAREKMEDWRKYYNEERPHGAIGQKPPITLLNHDGAASPPS